MSVVPLKPGGRGRDGAAWDFVAWISSPGRNMEVPHYQAFVDLLSQKSGKEIWYRLITKHLQITLIPARESVCLGPERPEEQGDLSSSA